MSGMHDKTSHSETQTDVVVKLQTDVPSDNPFSEELGQVFQVITYSVLCQAVALFGVGSNIINIICFVKQEFKDPVNVSFLGLAVSDLCSLVTIMWTNLCFTPTFIATDLPFEPIEFQYLTGAIPHTTFTRISSWITAIIALERCLCIIAPIKVKSIVTSERVCIAVASVFVIIIATTAPFYFVNGLGFKFYPDRNKTLIGMVFMGDRESVEFAFYIINQVCFPFGAFIVIIISTTILVIQLNMKTKWRNKATTSAQADSVSTRTQKVTKMAVMISTLFISCFIPVCAFFIAMSLVSELSVVGKYRVAVLIFGGFVALLDCINSAANIFIYFHMSSKYRAALRQLFHFGSNP